jgi:hypothetical protein
VVVGLTGLMVLFIMVEVDEEILTTSKQFESMPVRISAMAVESIMGEPKLCSWRQFDSWDPAVALVFHTIPRQGLMPLESASQS